MLSTEHIVALSLMDLVGLCVNALFLYTIKVRPAPLNAIDVLQACRTSLVLVALLVCIWLEVVTCATDTTLSMVQACMGSTVIVDNMLFHSTCWSFLSVACVRRKVCECRGRASVLVTPRYAIKTMVLCLTPVGMFMAAGSAMMSNVKLVETNNNTADVISSSYVITSNTSRVTYDLCQVIILNITPLLIGCVLYYRIFMMVTETARNMDRNITQRNRSPTKLIKISVIILLSVTCTAWGVYIVMKIVSIFQSINTLMSSYMKLVVLISYPFGEGLLQTPSTRNKTVLSIIQNRSTRQVGPPYSHSVSSITGSMADCGSTFMVSQLPALIEEKESWRQQSHGDNSPRTRPSVVSNDAVFTKRRKRSSVRYSRQSVVAKHAASIGLEWREQSTFPNQVRPRRESEERFRSALKSIDDDEDDEEVEGYKFTRRLSTCLRLASIDDDGDQIKRFHNRRGSKRSDKQRHNESIAEEYKGLSYAQLDNSAVVTESPSSSGFLSPSMRRWKRLFTTARTANKFSKVPKQRSAGKDAAGTSRERNAASFPPKESSSSLRKNANKLSTSSLTQSEMYNLFAVKRKSMDKTKADDNNDELKQKRRTKSIASNVFSDTDQSNKKQRNKSVSFVSSIVVGGQPSTSAVARSFSCDAKIYLNYNNESDTEVKQKAKRNKHHSENRYSRHSRDQWNDWHLRKDTTREECIEKLLEMKDYF